jgi:hypothetical protein
LGVSTTFQVSGSLVLSWTWLAGPGFLGNIIHHFVLGLRNRRALLLAMRSCHLVPTVFRSTDAGKTRPR